MKRNNQFRPKNLDIYLIKHTYQREKTRKFPVVLDGLKSVLQYLNVSLINNENLSKLFTEI